VPIRMPHCGGKCGGPRGPGILRQYVCKSQACASRVGTRPMGRVHISGLVICHCRVGH